MNELQEVKDRLVKIEEKADAIFRSAEKTRKYFLATLIVTILTIVVPMIGMVIAIPYFMSTLDLGALGL